MIEEFPFTTKILQTEKDIHSLQAFIVQAIKETKERLASQTWARLTWEQRVTNHLSVFVPTATELTSKIVNYYGVLLGVTVRCETLSQMQF